MPLFQLTVIAALLVTSRFALAEPLPAPALPQHSQLVAQQKERASSTLEHIGQISAFMDSPQARALFAKGPAGQESRQLLLEATVLHQQHAAALSTYATCLESAADRPTTVTCQTAYQVTAGPLTQQIKEGARAMAVRLADTFVTPEALKTNEALLAKASSEYGRVFQEANTAASLRLYNIFMLDTRYRLLLTEVGHSAAAKERPAIQAVLMAVSNHQQAVTAAVSAAVATKACLLRATRQQEFGGCWAAYITDSTAITKAYPTAKVTLLKAIAALPADDQAILEGLDRKIGAFGLLALIPQLVP